MILINPPVVKPCEAPPGLAKIAGSLKRRNIRYRAVDMNLEGILYLLGNPGKGGDKWTSRAIRGLGTNLKALRSFDVYSNPARYGRAVKDVNRVLEMSVNQDGIRVSLTDFKDGSLSPIRSRDLLEAGASPERNPFYPFFSERLSELLEQESTRLIGFSLNYLSQALSAFAMIGFLKREWPDIEVVLGGGLVTSWMRRPDWKDPFKGLVNHCIEGPGEGALLSLSGHPGSPEDSIPDYAPFFGKPYMAPGFILPYSASRGCYWRRCSFCPETAEGNPYRPLSPNRVIRELSHLKREYGPLLIHFLDNAMSPSLLKALIEHPPGVPWYGFAKITSHLADPDFCMGLKGSGCAMLELGLESGDQKVLREMRKGIDLESASRALKNTKDAGIPAYVYLLFGTPMETPSSAGKTLSFTARHGSMIDFLNLAIFNMPVHGPDSEKFENIDFYEGDLSLYRGFEHPDGWNRDSVRRFLDREFKRDPIVASILRRSPPLFTSNHAPFFLMAGSQA